MKVLLVCSTGGHFRVMKQLRPFWETHDRVWVTFRTPGTQTELAEESVHWAFSPTNRNLPNLFRNLWLAQAVIRQEKPDVVLTTGAGVAVPFIILGKLMGCRTSFIESITRVSQLSLSARLALTFIDVLYVHWAPLRAKYPHAELISH